jgi:hypothetical protein
MGPTNRPDWKPLAALGAAVLAVAFGRKTNALHLQTSEGELVLATDSIVAVEASSYTAGGQPGTLIRTDSGQIVTALQSPDYVLPLLDGFYPLRAAKPAERRCGGMVHVRPSAITAIKESPFRVVGSDHKDVLVSLQGGYHLLVRETLRTVQSIVGR